MFLGETIATGAKSTCEECGVTPKLEILRTCAYYIGTQCKCGPYSRESDYFHTRAQAERIFATLDPDPRKNPNMRS